MSATVLRLVCTEVTGSTKTLVNQLIERSGSPDDDSHWTIGSWVGGGWMNESLGDHSSISGGSDNTARRVTSSVVGGKNNQALEDYSSIVGGDGNITYGEISAILGGLNNQTGYMADRSSVTGGKDMHATGWEQVVP